jgi:hypothetical protein
MDAESEANSEVKTYNEAEFEIQLRKPVISRLEDRT